MQNNIETPEWVENEPEFTRKTHLKPQLYNDTLQAIFKTSGLTLDINRQGRLTSEQRTQITDELKEQGDGVALLLNIFLGVSLLLAFIFLSEGLPMLSLVIGASIMLGGLFLFTWRRQNRLKGDLAERVKHVEGLARLHDIGSIEGTKGYGLIIDNHYFQIDREQFNQLNTYDLPPLRAYFYPHSKKLLALEVLPYDAAKLKNDLEADPQAIQSDTDPVTAALLEDEARRQGRS